jgi:DNA-binding NtrC family response regulator
VLPLQIPPLRQRKEDIPLISEHLIRKFQKEEGTKMVLISPEVMEILQNYYWPGNVRELANVLERILYTIDGDTVLPRHLPIILQSMGKESPKFEETVLKRLREDVEKEILLHTIRISKDNKNRAARMLGIHRTSLYKKMKKFNIPLKNA